MKIDRGNTCNAENVLFRIIEVVTVTLTGIILFYISSIPNPVYLLQGLTEVERSALPRILIAITAVGSPLLTFAFQVFVYFGLTQNSNNLLTYRCILLLLLPITFPAFFSLVSIDIAWFADIIHFLIYVKHFLIPLEILLSSNEAKLHFRIAHSEIFDDIRLTKVAFWTYFNTLHYVITISNNRIEPYELNIV